jgi:two-component system sensor kinase FixL
VRLRPSHYLSGRSNRSIASEALSFGQFSDREEIPILCAGPGVYNAGSHAAFAGDAPKVDMYDLLFKGGKSPVLFRAGILIAAIAFLDWLVVAEVLLGFLYLVPMLMVGSVLGRRQICAVAALCTFLAETFSDLAWNLRSGISRDVLYFAAFAGTGFFIREVSRNRRAAEEHLQEIERQRDARREAEEQLRVLIESSPAAILTANGEGCVLTANEAAHRMLGVPPGELNGRVIHRHLPALSNISLHDSSQQPLRTTMQARGQREDGETFLADICFSTYRTNAGMRLTAMVLDASEDLRTHEVSGLHQLLVGSRIAIGAVSHEIRNVCGAIAVVHRNLERDGLLAGNKDFEALGNLAAALARIASVNLHQAASEAAEVDLAILLEELKIVVAPSLRDDSIDAEWIVEPNLQLAWADRPSLMQVFLNLMNNSVRALSRKKIRKLSVTAKSEAERILVEVADSGGGVTHPEHLFHPFQAGAEATGLGLYLSQAFLHSFGGELRYRPLRDGACFTVYLTPAISSEQEERCAKSGY